jgi:hydrogenase maturation protein HypF
MDLVRNNVRCFRSTSAGRLFDAVAAILGFVGESTFEGQAAIWLEMQARNAARDREYSFPNFDHRPLLSDILKDRVAGHGISEIARGFHISLAKQLALQIVKLCSHYHVSTTALSGGVFQNKLLFDLVHGELQDRQGPRLITNRIVPVNDGGLCLGQAAMACGDPATHATG